MATIRIAATGDKEKGINEINPRFQANALRNIRGIDCGVLANNFYSEDRDYYGINKVQTDATLAPFRMISCASSGIQIGAGMATAYGYDFQIEESETVSVLDDGETSLSSYINNTSGTRYVFVYLEWDITGDPGIGSVKLHGNGTAGIWRSLTTSNANLIDNPRGIYKLPIYRVEITNGTLTYVSWEDMNLCPTITRPQVAEVAVYAQTMAIGDDSDRVATTKYADAYADKAFQKIQSLIDEINDGLNFGNSTFTVAGVDVTIKRLGGYVIGTTYASEAALAEWTQVEAGGTAGTIPVGYRPQKTEYGLIYRYELYEEYYLNNGRRSDPYTSRYTWRSSLLQISTDGTITAISLIPTGTDTNTWHTNQGTNYTYYQSEYYPTDTAYFVIGYTTNDKLTLTMTAFDKHPLTLNYDSSKVCATAPTYYEIGVPFTLKAIALGYGEECVIDVTGGSISGGADGEYTVTPTSTVCVISISTRYFNGGTDENGDDGVTSAPQIGLYLHNVTIDEPFELTPIHIEFTFTSETVSTACDTLDKIAAVFGSDEIPCSGSFTVGSLGTYEITSFVVLDSQLIGVYTSEGLTANANIYASTSTITDVVTYI